MGGRVTGDIVGGRGLSLRSFGGRWFRWGVRGWENGSRGCARPKFNHVKGSQSKSIRKAISGLPRALALCPVENVSLS